MHDGVLQFFLTMTVDTPKGSIINITNRSNMAWATMKCPNVHWHAGEGWGERAALHDTPWLTRIHRDDRAPEQEKIRQLLEKKLRTKLRNGAGAPKNSATLQTCMTEIESKTFAMSYAMKTVSGSWVAASVMRISACATERPAAAPKSRCVSQVTRHITDAIQSKATHTCCHKLETLAFW